MIQFVLLSPAALICGVIKKGGNEEILNTSLDTNKTAAYTNIFNLPLPPSSPIAPIAESAAHVFENWKSHET